MTDPIRAKIIELVPEIMELKFGCQVLFKDIVFNYVCRGREGRGPTLMLITPNGERATVVTAGMESMKYEILGRPTQLADVLRAIEEYRNSLDEEKQEWWSVDTRGEFLQLPAVKGILPCWNLALDFDNQTPEVKAFIGKLIGA